LHICRVQEKNVCDMDIKVLRSMATGTLDMHLFQLTISKLLELPQAC